MNNLTYFATMADYNAAKDNLDLPNVSGIGNDQVEYLPYVEPTPPTPPTPTGDSYIEIYLSDYYTSGDNIEVKLWENEVETVQAEFQYEVGYDEQRGYDGGYSVWWVYTPDGFDWFELVDGNVKEQLYAVNWDNADVSQFTAIQDDAFSGCTHLNSITIPSAVTTIGANAFKGTALNNITIPSGVTTIAVNAFITSTLKMVKFDEGWESALADFDSSYFSGSSNLIFEIPQNQGETMEMEKSFAHDQLYEGQSIPLDEYLEHIHYIKINLNNTNEDIDNSVTLADDFSNQVEFKSDGNHSVYSDNGCLSFPSTEGVEVSLLDLMQDNPDTIYYDSAYADKSRVIVQFNGKIEDFEMELAKNPFKEPNFETTYFEEIRCDNPFDGPMIEEEEPIEE